MALDFPSNANPGDVYTGTNLITYTFDGVKWNAGSEIKDFIPEVDSLYDLGSPSKKWRHLYVSSSSIFLGTASLTLSNGNLTVNGAPLNITTSTLFNGTSTLQLLVGAGQPYVVFPSAYNTQIQIQGNEIAALDTATLVLSAGGSGIGNVHITTFDPTPNTWVFGNDATLAYPDGTTSTGASVYVPYATSSSYKITTELDMGGGPPYIPYSFEVQGAGIILPNGNGYIRSGPGGGLWALDSANQSFDFPNSSRINYGDGGFLSTGTLQVDVRDGGIFEIKLNDSNKTWTFDNNGALTFPDGTTQTTALVGGAAGVSSISAGTGTFVTSSTGAITIWTSPTGGGITNPSNDIFTLTNTTSATSTITGVLQVAGGVGIRGSLYASVLRQDTDEFRFHKSSGLSQGVGSIALGAYAGQSQGVASVAIGINAGKTSQSSGAVAIGDTTGQTSQGTNAIAIGQGTGAVNQSGYAVAVGASAGYQTQGSNSVAIGYAAGNVNQGSNSVAIGYGAGQNLQAANSIILNATGAYLQNTATTSSFIVKPIRNINSDKILYYNTSTGEISYSSTASFNYTPSTPANWTGSPTVGTVSAALDELASRTVTLEGATISAPNVTTYFMYNSNANYSMTQNVEYIIPFDTPATGNDAGDYDTGTKRFTPTIGGWYLIECHLNFTGVWSGNVEVIIYKNNNAEKIIGTSWIGNGGGVGGSALVYFNGGADFIEIRATQKSGGVQSLEFGTTKTWFQATWIKI